MESAGAGSDLPWTGYDENIGVHNRRQEASAAPGISWAVSHGDAGLFQRAGDSAAGGRFFTEADKKDAPWVLIINHAMAEHYWPNEEVVGKRITFADTAEERDWITIVGVVGDVKDQPNSPGAEPAFWWSESQVPSPTCRW